MLSRFRVGNAGLGNRAPIHGLKESIKECPLCLVSGHHFPLNEIHVAFECSTLVAVQESGGMIAYRNRLRGKDNFVELLGWRWSRTHMPFKERQGPSNLGRTLP